MTSDLGLEFGSLTRKKKSCPVCGGDTYTMVIAQIIPPCYNTTWG